MSGGNGGAPLARAVVTVALLLLAVAVAYSEFARHRGEREARQRDAALAEEIAAVRSEARAAFTSLIPQEIVGRANASVYAIVVNNRLFGTAFVIDRENGVLATAAHVAEALPLDDDGAIIVVLNRFNGVSIPVRTIRSHAGYGAFRTLIENFQPVRPQTPILRPQILPLRDLAFDVALLTVDPIDPDTNENRLGPDLPLAPEMALLALSAGAPIAVIGFPYDTLDDSFAAESATSRVDRGIISAMIAPLDNAAIAGDPVIANLIIHRLSTAGGSSGSPVINAAGKVVGIHTHGIESVSSNADGAAQRADVLYDMLEEDRDHRRLTELFIPAWRRVLIFWRSAKDVLPWSFYLERANPASVEDILISDFDFAAPAPFSIELRALEFGDSQEGFTVAAADLVLTPGTRGGEMSGDTLEVVSNGGQPVFQIDREGEFASSTFIIDRSKNNVLYAFDYSLRRQLGFCRLTTYWREIGDRRLAIQPARASAELFFAARAGGGEEQYEVIFHRRKNCDPASQAFDAGVLTWKGEEAFEPARNIVRAFFPRPDQAQFQAPEPAGLKKILNVSQLGCMFTKNSGGANCGLPDYIEVEFLAAGE